MDKGHEVSRQLALKKGKRYTIIGITGLDSKLDMYLLLKMGTIQVRMTYYLRSPSTCLLVFLLYFMWTVGIIVSLRGRCWYLQSPLPLLTGGIMFSLHQSW